MTDKVSNERLAEMLKAFRPPAARFSHQEHCPERDLVSVLTELLSLRNAQSEAVAVKGEVAELIAWLRSRAEADSGLRYGDNSAGVAEASVFGYDAAFVAEHFHGRGAATLADALSALTHPAPPLAVTDEMVQAGVRAFYDDAANPGLGLVPDPYDNMRAALTAALEAKQ